MSERVILWKHQKVAIKKMEALEAGKVREEGLILDINFGVLALPVGSGKTIACLKLIKRDRFSPVFFKSKEAFTNRLHWVLSEVSEKILPYTVVVCSLSLVSRWVQDIRKLNMNFVIAKKSCIDSCLEAVGDPEKFIILCPITVSAALSSALKYKGRKVKRVIYDEYDTCKISRANIEGCFYWLVSGTSSNYKKNYLTSAAESIMDTAIRHPSLMRHVFITADVETHTRCEVVDVCIPVKNLAVRVLGGIVNPSVITMIASGDVKSAMTALGVEGTESIFDRVMSIFNAKLDSHRARLLSATTKSAKEDIKKDIDETKRQLNLLKDRLSEIANEECCICRDELKQPCITKCCYNVYCSECILSWIVNSSGTCPYCRNEITQETLMHQTCVGCEEEPRKRPDTFSNKEDALLHVLSKTPSGVIVFSNNVKSKVILGCLEGKCESRVLKGRATQREAIIRDFNSGELDVVVIDSSSDCAGIELPTAECIVFFHEVSSEVRDQCVGRVLRPGRKKCNLTVYTLKDV